MSRSYAPRHRSPFFRWESGGLFSALVVMLVVALTVGGVGVASAGKATAATTPLGTITKSGTDLTNGSTATAGGAAGTANPGDTLQWVLNYSNTQSSPVTANITDPITGNQSYVPGSLQVPPGMTTQYSTNGGTSYTSTQPASGVNAVGATGTGVPGTTGASSPIGAPSSSFATSTTGGDGWQALTYTGDVTVHNVTVADKLVAPAGPAVTVTCPTGDLAPGASLTCTSSAYTVTQADVDAGSVANTATAHGLTPDGKDVPSNPSNTTTTTPNTADMSLVKSAKLTTDANGDGKAGVGDQITYSFHVVNTGSVTLHNVTIADQLVAPAGPAVTVTCPTTTLAPGASLTCTSSAYTVTQADVDAGSVANMATAHGTTPQGPVIASNDSRVRVATGASSELTWSSAASGYAGGLLAFTGSNVIPLTLAGLLAIIIGLFLTVASRRRREQTR